MVRISDARMSGMAFGTVVLHVTPEAAAGGPWPQCATATWSPSTSRPARWICRSTPKRSSGGRRGTAMHGDNH